jgi:hypothetical protein
VKDRPSFRDLLASASRWEAQQREEYIKFLRSTPHPDEPHWCHGGDMCVLCELIVARETYEDENEEPWFGTDATLISYGYKEPVGPFVSLLLGDVYPAGHPSR